MATTRHTTSATGAVRTLARQLAWPAVGGGLLGGLLMIVVMMLVMGISGMGWASPLNLGMAGFVFTISPPLAMLPTLMPAMGIHLPADVMSQLAPALQSGRVPSAMMHKLGTMLSGMGVPAPKVQMIGQLMSGQASNDTVATLMGQMPPAARNMVMAQMPVDADRVLVGAVLHFAFAAFLGILFAVIIVSAAYRMQSLRSPVAVMGAGVLGGAIVYVINRWILLPPTNPMMALAPQTAFFLTHLLFGLAVGAMLARALRRVDVRAALQR